jgi:hypothetical protein
LENSGFHVQIFFISEVVFLLEEILASHVRINIIDGFIRGRHQELSLAQLHFIATSKNFNLMLLIASKGGDILFHYDLGLYKA